MRQPSLFARRLLYWLSMAAGLVLAIVPRPSWLDPVRPDLALLAMIYFILTSPRIAGLGYAWLSGLFLDVLRPLPPVLDVFNRAFFQIGKHAADVREAQRNAARFAVARDGVRGRAP